LRRRRLPRFISVKACAFFLLPPHSDSDNKFGCDQIQLSENGAFNEKSGFDFIYFPFNILPSFFRESGRV
jgi:hypothetical protein